MKKQLKKGSDIMKKALDKAISKGGEAPEDKPKAPIKDNDKTKVTKKTSKEDQVSKGEQIMKKAMNGANKGKQREPA